MLRAGADKVSLNTAAVNDPDVVRAGADEFGDQCIVVAIDARRRDADDPGAGWEVVTHGGRTPTGLDAVEWAVHVCDLGAGEILLTSMDRDGTKVGYDLELLRAVGDAVDVPVIASGGVGTLEHLYEGATEGGATGAAGGLDLPLRPAHGPGGEGRPGRARAHRPALITCSAESRSDGVQIDADRNRKWFRAAPCRGTVTGPSAGLGARHGAKEVPMPETHALAHGSAVDDHFFRRYRALLDAEDCAFDELEHAYEDGDRSAFESDLAAWRSAVDPPGVVPRSERPLGGADAVVTAARSAGVSDRAVDADRVSVTTRSVRPTKKWLAPGTIATRRVRSTSRRLGCDLGGRAELVVLGEHELLRPRVVARRVERRGGSAAAARSRPSPRRGGRRPPSAMSAPNDQPTSASGTRGTRVGHRASSAATTSSGSSRPSA